MKFTPKIYQAINTAALLHSSQTRKADGLPYITHPFAVALILTRYTRDQDVIIAGLLHDTLEDTDYRAEDISHNFGPHVTHLVQEVTEPAKTLPWQPRKEAYLAHLATASPEAKLICAADKLHNLQSIITATQTNGPEIYSHFNAPMDKKLWFFRECLKILENDSQMPKTLIKDIDVAISSVYTKEFKYRTDQIAQMLVDNLNNGMREG